MAEDDASEPVDVDLIGDLGDVDLNVDQAVELAKSGADYAYFIDTYGVIDDAQGHGDGGGTMAFRLWPDQVRVCWLLMVHRLVVILKARQLGISWIGSGYALWLCLFHPGKLVLLYSQGELEAVELLRRIKVLYERLPDWVRDALPQVLVDNTTQLGWSNGSRIQSLPATRRAGRGNAASLVIVDEAAFLPFAVELYTALKPTIDGGGQLILISTANGATGLFFRIWTRAVAGLNTFKTIFLPWWSRPGRDQAWYDRQVADSSDPASVPQEYPGTSHEAFLASGRVRFAPSWISAQAPNVRPPMPRELWPESLRAIRGLTLWSLPRKGSPLILAADVAEGLDHGDYSAAVLIDAATWEELGELHGRWEPDEYGKLLHLIAEAYDAQIAVERNNHGHTTLAALKALRSRRVILGHDDRPGWLTNAQTKPQAVDALAIALRDGLLQVRSQPALDELADYLVLLDGGTGAPSGSHDDRVSCRAIAMGSIKMGFATKRKITVS